VTTCRAALYARVNTKDQNLEAQLGPLREYACLPLRRVTKRSTGRPTR
jgi:hypothetical protein